jgi:hypothetical protein
VLAGFGLEDIATSKSTAGEGRGRRGGLRKSECGALFRGILVRPQQGCMKTLVCRGMLTA